MFHHKRYTWTIFVFLFSVSITGLVGCDRQPQQAAEIRIGLITYLDSNKDKEPKIMEHAGLPDLHAAELAVGEINRAGGLDIGGQKANVVLIVEDITTSPEAALAAAQRLINQKNVVAIVGPEVSQEAVPVAKLANEARIPMISQTSTHPDTTAGKRYAFRTCFVDDVQAKVLARFARDDLMAQQAAFLYRVTNMQIRNIAATFQQTFEEMGGQVVASETYLLREGENLHPQLERIKASGAEVLFLSDTPTTVELIVPQVRQAGIQIPLLSDDRCERVPGSTLIPEFEGAFHTTQWHPDLDSEQSQAFVKKYHHAYPQTNLYDCAALTYDAFGMIFSAIRHQGKADPDSIRDGLYNMGPYTGVTGTIEYRDSGDPVRSVLIMQIQGGVSVFYKQVNP